MQFPKLFLKSKRESSILRRHPWVFSGAIDKADGKLVEGDIAEVCDRNGSFLALGHLGNGSIALRIFSFEQVEPNEEYWKSKIAKAWNLRAGLGLTNSKSTTMFRLVHGEGDGLPGLIVDVYNGTAVIQCHSMGMYLLREIFAQAILECSGSVVHSVYDKSAETMSKIGLNDSENAQLHGDFIGNTTALEYGIKYKVDWEFGQKTGFFIDQRENRKLLGEMSAGKRVLNTFCYTGGFSMSALQAGAKTVHSLDSSQKALDLTLENIALNKFEKLDHKVIKADAVEYLKNIEEEYDIIVLDPPAFAKHQSAKHAAVQAYKRINLQAIQQVKSGGFIFTFSCSQAVDKELFNNTIRSAAIDSGRVVKIIHQLHQPADHPINIYHPEGEYLKGLVLFVE